MNDIFKYTDLVIALVLVIGCLVLLTLGIDSEVKSILTMAAGWAFGRGYGTVRTIQGG